MVGELVVGWFANKFKLSHALWSRLVWQKMVSEKKVVVRTASFKIASTPCLPLVTTKNMIKGIQVMACKCLRKC